MDMWLPEGWYSVDKSEAAAAENELVRELHISHILHGVKVTAIARRRDSDEWRFELSAGQIAQVHLTFAVESTSQWPRARIFDDRAQWVQAVDGV